MGFRELYANGKNMNYYMLSSPKPLSSDWIQIDQRITQSFVYSPKGNIAVYSDKYDIDLIPEDTVLEMLICLNCFCHILRQNMQMRETVLDDTLPLTIQQWRVPCETTVVYATENEGTFYLEGCSDQGVFWRNIEERPKTIPPFVSCGALDQNGGCWMEECPHGAYFKDQEGPYTLPI